MSGSRQLSRITDSTLFVGYRWVAWAVAVGVVLLNDTQEEWAPLLLITAVLNLLFSFGAQRYMRLARQTPALMLLEVVVSIVALVAGGGWQGPFGFYVTSSLVLPTLLFGWRGSIMASLAFIPLYLSANWGQFDLAPTMMLATRPIESALTLIVPVGAASLIAAAVYGLRRLSSPQSHPAEPPASKRPAAPRPAQTSSTGFGGRFPTPPRSQPVTPELSLALKPTAVRTAEQSNEELRRAIFAPLLSDAIELPMALDTIAARFGQYTGIVTRVTLLGRARSLPQAHWTVLVRLAQEALLNIHQHAQADVAELTLRYDASSVALLVQDDGVGLADGTYERPRLHALRAMHYRFAELGGRIDVFELERGGVTVRATLPLD